MGEGVPRAVPRAVPGPGEEGREVRAVDRGFGRGDAGGAGRVTGPDGSDRPYGSGRSYGSGRPGPPGASDEPLLRDLVGAALRRARLRQGRTLRDVADRAQVSLPYLSEIERGRKEPSSEVLAAVCRALGLHLVDLLGALHTDLTSTAPVTVTVSLTSRLGTRASAPAHRGRPHRNAGRRDGQAMGVLLAA